MRKTIKSLEDRIEWLERDQNRTLSEKDLLAAQVKFYTTHVSILQTAMISLEKMNDVMAHVVSDMKVLRNRPEERR